MKAKLATFIFLAHSLFMASCHKSDDTVIRNPNPVVTAGSWRVSLFADSGNDETSDFSGYSFTFNADGSLSAVKAGMGKTGTWSSGSKFIINLGDKGDGNKPLGELTDDWHILFITSNEIKLGDDNPASGELLTFSRN